MKQVSTRPVMNVVQSPFQKADEPSTSSVASLISIDEDFLNGQYKKKSTQLYPKCIGVHLVAHNESNIQQHENLSLLDLGMAILCDGITVLKF